MFNVESGVTGHDEGELSGISNIRNPDEPSPSAHFETKFRDILNDFNSESWNLFEETLEEYIEFSKKHVGLKDISVDSNNKNEKFNAKDPAKVQRLYRRNRRKATREVLNKPNTSCSVPHCELKEKFFSEHTPIFDESAYISEEPRPVPPELIPFTANEIRLKVQKCENTALRQDRLTYNY